MLATMSIEFTNLGIKIQNLPKGITIGNFTIAFYGMIIATAILAGMTMAFYEAKRTGQDVDTYIDFALVVIVACIIGARAYYVAFEWSYYREHPSEIINYRQGGLAIYGAVITGVLVAFIYSKVKKLKFGLIADTAIPGLILGQIIGRWGNFFNREAFGGVAKDSNPFAMRLYFDDYFKIYDVPQSVLDCMETTFGKSALELGYVQVQPTFLYESLLNVVVLICMIIVARKFKKFDGQVLLTYLLGYGIVRFYVEGMRTDQLLMPVTGWPISQVLSLVLAISAFILLIFGISLHQKKKNVKSE